MAVTVTVSERVKGFTPPFCLTPLVVILGWGVLSELSASHIIVASIHPLIDKIVYFVFTTYL